MSELSKENSSANYKERVYLKRSVEAIKFNTKFQDGVNALNLSLKGLTERGKELSPDVLKLNKDLIEVYGGPDYRGLNGLPDDKDGLTTYSLMFKK